MTKTAYAVLLFMLGAVVLLLGIWHAQADMAPSDADIQQYVSDRPPRCGGELMSEGDVCDVTGSNPHSYSYQDVLVTAQDARDSYASGVDFGWILAGVGGSGVAGGVALGGPIVARRWRLARARSAGGAVSTAGAEHILTVAQDLLASVDVGTLSRRAAVARLGQTVANGSRADLRLATVTCANVVATAKDPSLLRSIAVRVAGLLDEVRDLAPVTEPAGVR